jgi:hypothetical protein
MACMILCLFFLVVYGMHDSMFILFSFLCFSMACTHLFHFISKQRSGLLLGLGSSMFPVVKNRK